MQPKSVASCDYEVREVSQMVKPMMTPRTAVQRNKPSDTGPSEPSLAPPGEPWFSIVFKKVMMSRLPSGLMLASLKTGMFCGPVTMAL